MMAQVEMIFPFFSRLKRYGLHPTIYFLPNGRLTGSLSSALMLFPHISPLDRQQLNTGQIPLSTMEKGTYPGDLVQRSGSTSRSK